MAKKQVKIGLCGLGTVGSGVFNILQRNAAVIAERTGADVVISHVGARRDNPAADTSAVKVSRDIFDVAKDPDVDILLELIGGVDTAKDLVEQALQAGKHVVTANKALIAAHGEALFALAKAHGVTLAYEAAVAGGIPIIKALREGLAGNQIAWIAGIINGTTNFILTEMSQKGRAFDDVLKEAQELGYAEADPTFDVEGIDAAHKLVILAGLAFAMPFEMKKIYTEGITRLDLRDVNYARELGYHIKHLGIARQTEQGVELRVHPTLIPDNQLIANVDGVLNAVMVWGDAVGPTLYNGPGAGSEATGSAVIADIIDIARNIQVDSKAWVPMHGMVTGAVQSQKVLAIDEIHSEFYLRLTVQDQTGVLNQITRIFSEAGISIEAVIQKEPHGKDKTVPLILLTSKVQEGVMNEAIEQIKSLTVVEGDIVKIRVEPLEG